MQRTLDGFGFHDDDDDDVIDLTHDGGSDDGGGDGGGSHVVVSVFDPGEVAAGLARYDSRERVRGGIEKLRRARMRRSRQKMPIGNLIDRVRRCIETESEDVFAGADRIGVEVQKGAFNDKQQAMQHGLMWHFGADRCLPVHAHAMRAHFRSYFPRIPPLPKASKSETKEARAKAQRAHRRAQKVENKRNAVRNGTRFVSDRVLRRCRAEIDPNDSKKHDFEDVLESAWYAWYIAETEYGIETAPTAALRKREEAEAEGGAAKKNRRRRKDPKRGRGA